MRAKAVFSRCKNGVNYSLTDGVLELDFFFARQLIEYALNDNF